MIEITVKLFAQYRAAHFKIEKRSYPKGATVEGVIIETDIPIEQFPIGVIMVNGRHFNEDYILQNGDILSLFPKVGGG
jgi:molybdopterin converting factor small subunit